MPYLSNNSATSCAATMLATSSRNFFVTAGGVLGGARLDDTIASPTERTRDLGGTLGTTAFTDAVIGRLGKR